MFHVFSDPKQWTHVQVQQWLTWAIREFSLEGVFTNTFSMDGLQLIQMGREDFLAKTPPFMGDILWEHLEILQKGTCEGKNSGAVVTRPFFWGGLQIWNAM
jgi:c-ets proto-oncogene protein